MYRGFDTLSGWVLDSLQALVLKLVTIATGALSMGAGWVVWSTALGRMQIRRAARQHTAAVQGDR
jgi:AAA family ATP:ADP antiporter